MCPYPHPLDILQRENTQPQIIRTDRGSETTMIGNAHYQLMQKQSPDISFEECYYYSTSTANQRIEAWWGQLTKSSIFRWRVCHRFRTFSMTSVNTLQTYFSMLQEDKLYDSHMLSDCIAFLAIYTPIIRREIFGFVRLWNVHRIRKQRQRPNSLSGQPVRLYIEDHRLQPNAELLQILQDDVAEWRKHVMTSTFHVRD